MIGRRTGDRSLDTGSTPVYSIELKNPEGRKYAAFRDFFALILLKRAKSRYFLIDVIHTE
jgi:hypothetical protein